METEPAGFDSVAYQTQLSQAHVAIRGALQHRHLDPPRYRVDIDPGVPIFAPRVIHLLRIAYNRHETLSVELDVPHEWLIVQTGQAREDFISAMDVQILALRDRVLAAGRPI